MRQSLRAMIVALGIPIAASIAASPAAAQVRGIPVYNNGVPRGIGLYGDVGLPNDDAGGGTAYGLTGRVGFGLIGVTAIVSSYDPDGPAGAEASVGATANYRLFGGPLVPLAVSLQAGLGYAKPDAGVLPSEEITEWRFPVGLGFQLTIPNPALAIQPWLAPRLDIVRTSAEGEDASTDTDFGLSGGVELNLLNGLGVHAAYDATFAGGGTPGTFGVGAHYNFRVPGL
jgi:hypothetical protein